MKIERKLFRKTLHSLLESVQKPTEKNIIVGFDGIVDEIVSVVDKRTSAKKFSPMKQIRQLSTQIENSMGIGGNIEISTSKIKMGGNGPLLANGLISLGFKPNYIGSIGYPKIHPLFNDFSQKCKNVVSVAQPTRTIAMEFEDGKIFMCNSNGLEAVNWENIKSTLVESMFAQADLIVITDWTLLPNANDITKNILKTLIKVKNKKAKIFVDIANPKRRKDKDILTFLFILKGMQSHNNVTLGLNIAEYTRICQVLGCRGKIETFNSLGLHTLCVHSKDMAQIVTEGILTTFPTFYTNQPKFLTGAGDNFNSGLCSGIVLELSPPQALCFGIATSAYFVRNGKPATLKQLIYFIKKNV